MAQDLKVLVLDALNGKPQAGVKVNYFCTGIQYNSHARLAFTDSEGLAEITYFCSDEEKIELWVTAPKKKQQCGDLEPLTLREIAYKGIVSKPDTDGGISCPTKVSKHLTPVPGQITMFVKKPTWLQSHF